MQTNYLYQLATKLADLNFYSRVEHYIDALVGAKYASLSPKVTATTVEQYLTSLASQSDFTYSFTELDCVTFVETVLALAHSVELKSLDEFKQQFLSMLQSLRYLNAEDNFFARHHIFCLDWLASNYSYLDDITLDIGLKPKIAETEIKRLNWVYRSQLRICNDFNQVSFASVKAILRDLQVNYPDSEVSKFNYLDMREVIENFDLLKTKLPLLSIICIVRPNWQLENKIGTNLNISHLGFCQNKQGQLSFIHASSIEPLQVVRISLLDYLNKFINSPTIKGISIFAVREHCGQINRQWPIDIF